VKSNGLEVAWEVLNRRKWLAILTFGGVFAAVVSTVMFMPDIYQSTATVLIERQQIPEAFVRSTITSGVEIRLEAMSQEALSRSRLEELIDHFDLYANLKQHLPMEEVIERMRRDIRRELKQVEQMGPNRATASFSVSFSGRDPQKVAAVTNTLASFYVEENIKVREQQAVETAQFLAAQLEEVKKRLDEQEQRLGKYKVREANLATLAQFNSQLRHNSDNLLRINERRTALARQLAELERVATTTRDGKPDATAVRLEQRIAELTQKLKELETRYTAKFPDIVNIKRELATLEEQQNKAKSAREPEKAMSVPASSNATELKRAKSAGEPEKGTSVPVGLYSIDLKRALGEADAEIKALRSEAESLRHSIAVYQQRIENSPRLELEPRTLEREYEATKESYQSLLKRQEEARLGENMEQLQKGERFRIVDPAIASLKPISPNRPRTILVGLFLSLGLAAGLVVLAEQLDTSFHKVDELRAFTRVPVLVSISQIITKADLGRRRKRFGLAAASAMVGLVLIVGLAYLVVNGNEQMVTLLARRGL
jgi:polysaccharide biosynthesis transport protein